MLHNPSDCDISRSKAVPLVGEIQIDPAEDGIEDRQVFETTLDSYRTLVDDDIVLNEGCAFFYATALLTKVTMRRGLG